MKKNSLIILLLFLSSCMLGPYLKWQRDGVLELERSQVKLSRFLVQVKTMCLGIEEERFKSCYDIRNNILKLTLMGSNELSVASAKVDTQDFTGFSAALGRFNEFDYKLRLLLKHTKKGL